jgi:hypothetical protein
MNNVVSLEQRDDVSVIDVYEGLLSVLDAVKGKQGGTFANWDAQQETRFALP